MDRPDEPRRPLRSNIPAHVRVPKFCTSKDIEAFIKMKEENPKMLWVDIISEVLTKKRENND
jgi:hypothetical protein